MSRERPRILHVLESSDYGAGASRHLIDLVENTPGLEHHAVLPRRASPRGLPIDARTAEALWQAGAHVHKVRMRRQVLHWDTGLGLLAMRRLVDSVEPDLVHGHSSVGGALARLASSRPTVYTPNGIHPSRAAAVVERRLGRRTTAAIAVSRGEASYFVHRLGLPADRVHVVPNGIGPLCREDRRELPELPVPADAAVIGWIGRHARQKAPDVLVRAARSIVRRRDDVHVVMIGGGPDIDRTRELVERLGLRSRVHVLGFVADARRLLGSFDVLTLPSRWEGAPYVPLEAMAEEIPLVLSRCIGNADLVEDSRTGWLVDTDDPDGLAAALLEALTNPDEARRRASAARARFEVEYRVDTMAERTRAVYDHVMGAA